MNMHQRPFAAHIRMSFERRRRVGVISAAGIERSSIVVTLFPVQLRVQRLA